MIKGFISMGFSVAYLLGAVLLAGAAPAGTLAQVIEGAKKEGSVTMTMRSNVTPKSMERLEGEVNKMYGVALKIKSVPSSDMRQDLTQAILEKKMGAPLSYDLMYLGDMFVPIGMDADIIEKVDWKPLLSKDTNPLAVSEHPKMRGALAFQAAHIGLMYNPEKVAVGEVPKTLRDLANPKWKGRVGIYNYEQTWARWYFILGKEKVLSDLQAILKNEAVRGRYVDLQNRYLLGEIVLCLTASNQLQEARDKGMPAAWRNLDFADIREYAMVVRKGAKCPNAAKLVALYLASPKGAKFMLEESGAGSLFYPGNLEQDISRQAKKEGVPEHSLNSYPGLVEFHVSEQYNQWAKEIRLIFETAQ